MSTSSIPVVTANDETITANGLYVTTPPPPIQGESQNINGNNGPTRRSQGNRNRIRIPIRNDDDPANFLSNPKSAYRPFPPAEIYPKDDLYYLRHPIRETREGNQYPEKCVYLKGGVIRDMNGKKFHLLY